MFQMFQYFIKGTVLNNINMYLGKDNDNEITFLINLFTEITLWYTMYVRHVTHCIITTITRSWTMHVNCFSLVVIV